MAIVKEGHVLHEVKFTFDGAGEVVDVNLVVSYDLKDDVANEILAQKGLSKSVWANLTPTQQISLNTFGKRFKVLAATF